MKIDPRPAGRARVETTGNYALALSRSGRIRPTGQVRVEDCCEVVMATDDCQHYWVIAPAWQNPGRNSPGVCRECGAVKQFRNSYEPEELTLNGLGSGNTTKRASKPGAAHVANANAYAARIEKVRKLVQLGWSDLQIADELKVTVATVTTYRSRGTIGTNQ